MILELATPWNKINLKKQFFEITFFHGLAIREIKSNRVEIASVLNEITFSPISVISPPGKISKSCSIAQAFTTLLNLDLSNSRMQVMFDRRVAFCIQGSCGTYAMLPYTYKSKVYQIGFYKTFWTRKKQQQQPQEVLVLNTVLSAENAPQYRVKK